MVPLSELIRPSAHSVFREYLNIMPSVTLASSLLKQERLYHSNPESRLSHSPDTSTGFCKISAEWQFCLSLKGMLD